MMHHTHSDCRDAAYQGVPGAYSEQAARRICGAGATLLPCETLSEAFAAVADRHADSAVVPIENTLAGTVPGVLTLLLGSGLVVRGEVTEWIDHVLAGPNGLAREDVREVLSHPVALAQCTRYFKAHPDIRAVPVFDTAGALQMVIQGGQPGRAAIAGRLAAELYGASILAEHLQDHPSNFTRFIRVGRGPLAPVASEPVRVMLAVRLAHRPGALANVLQSLAAVGTNLTRIDNSPLPGCPFEYEFLLEGVVARQSDLDAAFAAFDRDAKVRLIGAFAEGRASAIGDV